MDETAVANTLAFLRASEANEKKAVCKLWRDAARYALTHGRWACVRLTLDILREHTSSLMPDPDAPHQKRMERMHARFDPDAPFLDAPFLQHFRDAWALDAALVVQEITSSANDIECPRTAAAAFLAAVEPNGRDYDCIVRVVTAPEQRVVSLLADSRSPRALG